MAYSSDAASKRHGRAGDHDLIGDADWSEPVQPPRDWKKLALVVGLGTLSWVATYVGMLELIEANMGELPLVHKAIIGFSVAMLMIMIVWLLDQLFAPISLLTKTIYAAGYIFLTVISVGFGFGFYWKVLESRSEGSRSAESAVGQVQGALHAASTRLEQLQATLAQLTLISQQKAEQERSAGSSCPGSRPGDGPRRKMREDDAARFAFASEFVKGRVGAVRADIGGLEAEFQRIARDDKSTIDSRSGTRNEFMRGLSRKLDMTVTGFNAFRTDPQLKQLRQDLAERAERITFADSKGGTYACPDPQLQTALRGVVRAIDQLPELEKPKIAVVEGSEATIEAFRRLTATFYGALSFKLPPSADELRQLQQKAVQSVEQGGQAALARQAALSEQAGLSKRDYIPLAIAIFVDLCLLLVSMGRPVNRLHGLVPKMRAAERGPVYQILSQFSDIHKDEETREKFEIFRHVVFDFNGDYYVAVPLDAPYRMRGKRGEPGRTREYTKEVANLQLEAHLLANLFSSFEKERIFTRVYSPFLTTGVIQRKLWRQGSKFAGSEAFRVYRFKDGAWSEIILGAVMGAARRVDAEKRRRKLEQGHNLEFPDRAVAGHAGDEHTSPSRQRDEAIPGAAAAQPVPASARTGYAFGVGPDAPRTGPGTPPRHVRMPVHEPTRRVAERAARLAAGDAAALAQKFGPYARNVVGASGEDEGGERRAPSANYREMAAALGNVHAAREQVREAEVSVRGAANNNTAPPVHKARQTEDVEARAQAHTPTEPSPASAPASSTPGLSQAGYATGAANVVALPRAPVLPRSGEDVPDAPLQASATTLGQLGSIDVTVRRETASFSVPVSEARLPHALAGLIGQAIVTGQVARKAEAIASPQPPVLPEAPPPAPRALPADVIALPPPEQRGDAPQADTGRRVAGEPAD